MVRIIVALLVVAGAASANPWLQTYMSEVGFDSAGRPWVEFGVQPPGGEGYLHDALLVTGSSVCTLDFDLGPGEFVVLDSEVVAQGELAHGMFRLNPLADSLMLRGDFIGEESVRYPVFPTGLGSAPAPPLGASVACYTSPDNMADVANWYVDSTPTRCALNDDWSSIGGRVDMDSALTLDCMTVRASGRYGTMNIGYRESVGEYTLRGLGAGAYLVSMYARVRELGEVEVTYPESVRVGYSQAVGGINFRIPPSGVAEQQPPRAPVTPQATLIRGSMLIAASVTGREASAVLLDAVGHKVLDLKPGPNDVSRLPSGVYFVAASGERSAVNVRKVILQR
ncbi:MAG: hypothetical protein NTX53_04125 [candidate division WOR-3 bacterium]|nr:hypothetical protein [candidate division WOR-3 bacterium]